MEIWSGGGNRRRDKNLQQAAEKCPNNVSTVFNSEKETDFFKTKQNKDCMEWGSLT